MDDMSSKLVDTLKELIVSDDLLDIEILFLKAWLEYHRDISDVWPGSLIYEKILAITTDEQSTQEERNELIDFMHWLVEMDKILHSETTQKLSPN